MIMRHGYRRKYENVEIRQLEVADLEFLRKWRNDPVNTKYLRQIPYITPEIQSKWFYSYLEDKNEMAFAIQEVEKIQQLVGSMSLYNINCGQAEIGKILIGNSNAHGLGVCINALKAVMDIARNDLELKTIYLRVYRDNIPAVKVYERAGFTIEEEHLADNGMLEYTMRIQL